LTDFERERCWVGVAAPVDVGVIEPGEMERGEMERGEIERGETRPYFQNLIGSHLHGVHVARKVVVHMIPDKRLGGVGCVGVHRDHLGAESVQLLGHSRLDCMAY